MYADARNRTHVSSAVREEFEVKVWVHHRSVLSPLLFIIVLEALSCKFCVGCPWEMLYADDLVILAETFEGLMTKMAVWKNCQESKGWNVNMGKPKVDISIHCKPLENNFVQYAAKVSGRTQSSVVEFRFGFTKKCSDIPGRLVEDPDFGCRRCLGNAQAIDGRPCADVQLADGKLDVLDNFV